MKNIKKKSRKHKYTFPVPQKWKIREQQLLYSEESFLPENLPRLQELHSVHNLSAIFNECHNYVYANEGLLKDKIFHEIVKLLFIKLYDEKNATKVGLQFGITSSEYRSILANKPSSFEVRVNKLFDTVRNEYPSLFSDDSLKLKPLTLAYIVGRLQYVSLIQTPADVKGEKMKTQRSLKSSKNQWHSGVLPGEFSFFISVLVAIFGHYTIASQPSNRGSNPRSAANLKKLSFLIYLRISH